MRNPNRKTNTDANHGDIVECLESFGAVVYFIREPCDLVVSFSGRHCMVEIKRDPDAREPGVSIADYRFTAAELEYYLRIRDVAPYAIVTNRLQATQLLNFAMRQPKSRHVVEWCRAGVTRWADKVYRDEDTRRKLGCRVSV